MDKDAVYIDVKSNTFDADDDETARGLGEQMMVGLQGGRKVLGEDEQGISLFEKGGKVQELEDQDDETGEDGAKDTGRIGHRKARMAERNGDEDDEQEDEGFESGESGDEADLERLQQASEKHVGKSRKDKDKEVAGDIAFADSDSDLGSLSSADEDQELEELSLIHISEPTRRS